MRRVCVCDNRIGLCVLACTYVCACVCGACEVTVCQRRDVSLRFPPTP